MTSAFLFPLLGLSSLAGRRGEGQEGAGAEHPLFTSPWGAPITTAEGETAQGLVGQGIKGPKVIAEGGRSFLCWDVTMVAVVSPSSQSHHRVMMQGFGDSCPSHTLNPFKAH